MAGLHFAALAFKKQRVERLRWKREGERRRNGDDKPNSTAKPKSFAKLPMLGNRATAFESSRWRSLAQVKTGIVREIKAATSGASQNGPDVMRSDWIRSIGLARQDWNSKTCRIHNKP